MIKASYDESRNTVILEFSGRVGISEAEKLAQEVQKVIPKQNSGFKLLTDLTGVESVDSEIQTPIRKLMDFLNEKGVTEIVRVIPDPAKDIGLNIMSAFHYSKDVQFLTVQTREEAQARL
jgi:anti-anti-sigma regulatory factor